MTIRDDDIFGECQCAKYVHHVCVLRFDGVMTPRKRVIFDANFGYQVPWVLKYLNCLHKLCVTVTATGATVDPDGEQAKSAGKTTITNLLLFVEHERVPVTFTLRIIFASHLSLSPVFNF